MFITNESFSVHETFLSCEDIGATEIARKASRRAKKDYTAFQYLEARDCWYCVSWQISENLKKCKNFQDYLINSNLNEMAKATLEFRRDKNKIISKGPFSSSTKCI